MSLDSCGQAFLSRSQKGGAIRVTFTRGGKLAAETFIQLLLLPKLRNSKNVDLVGVIEDRADGYDLKLAGVTHGSIAIEHPSIV
jgi:hypothetical protein